MTKEIRKETDWFGREKEVVYDDGEKTGEFRNEKDFWGNSVKREYDSEGERVSETRHEQTFFGNPVDRTYDLSGDRISETRHEHTFIGTPVDRTYDNDDDRVSETRRETTFFGTPVKRVYPTQGPRPSSFGGGSDSSSGGSYSSSRVVESEPRQSTGAGIGFILLVAILCFAFYRTGTSDTQVPSQTPTSAALSSSFPHDERAEPSRITRVIDQNGHVVFTNSEIPTISNDAGIRGTWRGTFGDDSGTSAFDLEIEPSGEFFKGTANDSAAAGQEAPAEVFGSLRGAEIRFTKHYLPKGSAVSYVGTLAADGLSASGTWSLGSRVGHWAMSRAPLTAATASSQAISQGSQLDQSESTLELSTKNGPVVVRDFTKDPAHVAEDKQTVVVAESEFFSIVYYKSDQSFIISLLSQPISAAREVAETAFLKRLEISPQDACKLNASEGVPISVNPDYPGVNFRLSFCGSGDIR